MNELLPWQTEELSHRLEGVRKEPGMKFNIDEVTEAELVDLNHGIVERLRFLSQMRAHARMLEFKIGERSPSSRKDVFPSSAF